VFAIVSGEQLAAPIGGYARSRLESPITFRDYFSRHDLLQPEAAG
jgi:hypothetical protein